MKAPIALISSILLLCFFSGKAQDDASIESVQAKIDLSSNGEFFEIKGMALNTTQINQSLSYTLLVNKTDPETNNSNKNEQKGNFVLPAGERKILSTTKINASDKAKVILLLLLYDQDNAIVAKDRIVLNGSEEDKLKAKQALLEKAKLDQKEISEDYGNTEKDGVTLLRGLVVEDTKTKPGRDFFTSFSLKYRDEKINGEKIVVIEEVLALGSNTKILVKVENEIVFQFFVNPRANYIEQMVDYAVNRTDRYFQQIKKNRNQIRRY
ncbi:CsgE family curli-type amyloid fiber assembly protein [Marinirhabdus gelatinilytica]|uniref:Curli production assembly/transport component CsgE n=1 Tax=Marinirhabdus gelatinilytica TaxID=1703343 RepID=A0A370Q8M9_9FLAO|nr:CsgE family curli-type amyloid fiber assembly protein [Marinirhabdus gelatinilytica]RDK84724.1 hypothetical protein C8D94_10497 [Marinirhabdus gelatinilytica]